MNDDGTISIQLNSGSRQDLGILLRGLELPAATGAVPGGLHSGTYHCEVQNP